MKGANNMESIDNLRNEALTAIYKLLKTKAEDPEVIQSIDNSNAIAALSHACSQLESIDASKASTRALMDLYKSLDSYKNNGFNGMAGICLNTDN